MPSALDKLLVRARRRPDDIVAMTATGETVDAARLAGRVATLAAMLGGRSSVVGVLAEDGPDWMVGALAVRAIGATLVPLPLFFSAGQLAFVARDAGLTMIAVSPSQVARAADAGLPIAVIEDRCGDTGGLADQEGGVVAYTSGTTGRPKGVILDAGAIDIKALTLAAACGAGPGDRHFSVLPVSLLLELLCAVHVVLLSGGQVSFAPRGEGGWSAHLPDAATAAQPTVTVLVPALLAAWTGMLEATGQRAPHSLRFVAVGGAPVGEGLAERAWKVGLPVHEGYGLTECCSVVALNRPGERLAGTVGRPLPGVAVTIEDGEIVIADPSLMTGYLGGDTAPPRWRTGDLGRVDESGRLIVTGRRDDVIVTGLGRNVSPGWPEALVLADPAISHCAVLDGGAYPRAVIEPACLPESQARDLAACCWAGLPDYARPHDVTLVPPGAFHRSGWLRPDGSVNRRAVAAATACHDGQT
jgi:long-chain acyl-CoA synthetase